MVITSKTEGKVFMYHVQSPSVAHWGTPSILLCCFDHIHVYTARTQKCKPCFHTLPSYMAARVQTVQPMWKSDWQCPINTYHTTQQSHSPERNENTPAQRPLHKHMTALLIITPNWKPPKCPSAGEWTDGTRYSHTRHSMPR